MRNETRKQKKKKKTRNVLKLLLLLLLIGILAYVGYAVFSASQLLDSIRGEDLATNSDEDKVVLTNNDPFSVLLLGVDERPGDTGRADTIIVVTVNPETQDTKMLSIPRDTLITLPGSGEPDKINAAYAYDGIPLTVETVEEFLNIPIHYYAQVNFQGMVDMVDAVGGIDVNSPLEFTVQDSEENSNAIHIEKGPQHLNGEEALGYARMRKQDPEGDWGRQARQREVITEIIQETMSINTLANFNEMFGAIGPNMKTNFSGRELWALATNYTTAAQNIETLILEGAADYEYFPSYGQQVYVWVPYEETMNDIQQELRAHLELETASTANPSSSNSVSNTD